MNSTQVPPRIPYTFDRVVRILFTVCALVASVLLLDSLKGVLLPFIIACLVAYVLEPAVKWNMRWTRSRSRFIPVVLTLLEAAVIVAGCCAAAIPYIMSETAEMTHLVAEYASSQIQIPFVSDKIHEFLRDNIDPDAISKLLSHEEWLSLAKETLSSSWSFLSSSLAFILGVFSWLIVILYVVFIMLDYERIMLSFKQLVPKRHRKRTFRVIRDIEYSMNRYFRGQSLIAFIVGIMFSVGFVIIGLPMGVVLGLTIGLLNLVPYLQLVSLPVTVFLCLVSTATTGVDFWLIFWEAMAVYIVVQCIQDFFLTPKIMGKAMGLNPAIILLSLSVWGTLLGFMGLIIALPLTTLLISYYDQYISDKE